MFSTMRLSTILALSSLLVGEVLAGGPLCIANKCPHKRAIGFGDLNKNELVNLDKRQADPYATIYPLSIIPNWAALPFQSCGATSAGTKTICPVDFYCHCHSGTSSLCLPTATPVPYASSTTVVSGTTQTVTSYSTITGSVTGSCQSYTGIRSCSQCEFTWATTLTDMASANGQCGGYSNAVISQAWDKKTLCPVNYRCVDQNFWYSQCRKATETVTIPPPKSYWACGQQNQYYPTPTSEGMMCGGHCFKANGYNDGNCPGTMSCWTKTSPLPGFEAYCYKTSPPGGNWATSLCYPIPYDWPGYGAPSCKPQTANVQTPYGQCGGSVVNSQNNNVPWTGPTSCQCGYGCSTSSNGFFANCNPIPNFVNTCGQTLGAGTQTLYGRCGGSVYTNNSQQSWTYPTLCPAGASCHTEGGGWYAQCTPLANKRSKRAPSPEPVAMPAPEATAYVPYEPAYEAAKPGSVPAL